MPVTDWHTDKQIDAETNGWDGQTYRQQAERWTDSEADIWIVDKFI